MADVLINKYLGFGDNIYQRMLAQHLIDNGDNVYVGTCSPQFYYGMDVKFVQPKSTKLFTQNINLNRTNLKYCEIPKHCKNYMWSHEYSAYATYDATNRYDYYCKRLGVNYLDFQLNLNPKWVERGLQILRECDISPIDACLVKPPSIRREWCVPNRCPDPGHWAIAMEQLANNGKKLISIGCVDNDKEYYPAYSMAHVRFDQGQLTIEEIIGLTYVCSMVATYQCMAMVLALSVNTPLLLICGGYESPDALLDYRMGANDLHIIQPDNPCNCRNNRHECNKNLNPKELFEKVEKICQSTKKLSMV